MKKILLLLTLTAQISFAQDHSFSQLKDLKDRHQFNKMDSLNDAQKGKDYFFYKAVYANVTNHPKESLEALNHKQNKHLKNTFDYVRLVNDNAVKSFNYQLANQTSIQLITTYKNHLSTEDLADEINNQRIWEVLSNIPKQTLSNFTTSLFPTKKDIAGLITMEVKKDKLSSDFVFDTGAGISCITETEAQKFGLKILPDNQIEVMSFTGHKNKVRIGVAESFTLGEITINNAVFLVYPDEAFSFAGGKYKINGIIGFPIAKELGTITLEENLITATKNQSTYSGTKNFFVDQLRPIVVFEFQNKKLPANFDSGATSSLFTRKFYETFKTYIDQNGKLDLSNNAGAGGQIAENKISILSNQKIKIGNTPILFPELHIDIENYGVYGENNFANIGQDVLRQFKKVTLSFDHNYMLLDN